MTLTQIYFQIRQESEPMGISSHQNLNRWMVSKSPVDRWVIQDLSHVYPMISRASSILGGCYRIKRWSILSGTLYDGSYSELQVAGRHGAFCMVTLACASHHRWWRVIHGMPKFSQKTSPVAMFVSIWRCSKLQHIRRLRFLAGLKNILPSSKLT